MVIFHGKVLVITRWYTVGTSVPVAWPLIVGCHQNLWTTTGISIFGFLWDRNSCNNGMIIPWFTGFLLGISIVDFYWDSILNHIILWDLYGIIIIKHRKSWDFYYKGYVYHVEPTHLLQISKRLRPGPAPAPIHRFDFHSACSAWHWHPLRNRQIVGDLQCVSGVGFGDVRRMTTGCLPGLVNVHKKKRKITMFFMG